MAPLPAKPELASPNRFGILIVLLATAFSDWPQQKLRLAPRSCTGEGEAFTGGDDFRLSTGLRKQTGS